jgi:hypothetical protein
VKAKLQRIELKTWYVEFGEIKDGCHSLIEGDVTGIWGNVIGIRGNVTGIEGNVDNCEISAFERSNGIDITALINDKEIVR